MMESCKLIQIDDREFYELAGIIKQQCGISLKEEKKSLINCKLQKKLHEMDMDNFRSYYEYLIHDHTGNAMDELINLITINYTYFMREPNHFELLKYKVLKDLVRSIKDYDLRIWCAACSTGEEAYTLAMLLHDFFTTETGRWNSRLLATDLSSCALDIAKKGIYKTSELSVLPDNWLYKYFKETKDEFKQFKDELRNEIIFRRFNLADERFPFKKKFHIIFCRNVMIYFDPDVRSVLQDKLYDSLEHGGYLFIGHTESLLTDSKKFVHIAPSVYQKL